MSLNHTPSGDRMHIGFFGRTNAGKSSLINAVAGQELAVVSDTKGTTTDPVYKAMELLPLGPVLVIDTPGIDDTGSLGELRVRKTKQVLNKTDLAILVIDSVEGITEIEEKMIVLFEEKQVPYLLVYNKMDLAEDESNIKKYNGEGKQQSICFGEMAVSAFTKEGIHALKEKLAHFVRTEEKDSKIVGDLLRPMDIVVLVVPIDSAAPKGRLILPQQQVIRDILEAGAVSIVTKDSELEEALDKLELKPDMVITDSQVFKEVAAVVPENVYLTSFSILMARKKGFLDAAVKGVLALDSIQDKDKILIAEGCTHHRQCEDIGTVKLPKWIREYTGKEPEFRFCSGTEFPEDLSEYRLVLHCGGCMLNEREVRYRMKCAQDQKVSFTNYGITIAHMNGILKRSVEMLSELCKAFG